MAVLVGVSLATPAPLIEEVEGEVEGQAVSWTYRNRGTSEVQAVNVTVEFRNRTFQPTRIACRVQIFQADGRLIGERVVETAKKVQPVRQGRRTAVYKSELIEIPDPRAVIGGEDDGVDVQVESCWEAED